MHIVKFLKEAMPGFADLAKILEVNGPEVASIGASLSNLIPASLRPPTEDGTLVDQDILHPSVATEAQAEEVLIETSRLRKKKKKVKGNVAPIIESKETFSSLDTSAQTVTLASPFLTKETEDTEKLTEKLNSLLKTPDPATCLPSQSDDDNANVEFNHNPVELGQLGHVSSSVYDEPINKTLSDSKVVKMSDSNPLTPVANKNVGGLFPVNTCSAFCYLMIITIPDLEMSLSPIRVML